MPDSPERHVAVIVVHGVGYRPPGESASEVAHLLLRLSPPGGDGGGTNAAHYPVFHEAPLDYALRPLATVPDECPGDPGPAPPDRTFMRELIEAYEPDPSDRICESVRLSSERTAADDLRAEVHVYEMYWSDISSLGRNFLSIFASFFSLILHVPVLGRQALGFAHAVDGDAIPAGGWRAWKGLYDFAFLVFGVAIPVLTLLMVPLALAIMPVTQRDDLREVIAAVLPVVAAVGVTFAVQFRRRRTVTLGSAILSLAAGTAVALVVAWQWRFMLSPQVVLFEWWAIAGAALFPVFTLLERERRHVVVPGAALYVLLTAMLVTFSVRHHREASRYLAIRAAQAAAGVALDNPVAGFERAERAQGPADLLDDAYGRLDDALHHELARRTALFSILNTFEWVYVAVSALWALFTIAFLVTLATGWLVRRGARRDPARAGALGRIGRAAFTARLALAIPAVAFVFASFFAWGTYYNLVAVRLLPSEYAYVPEFRFPAKEFRRLHNPGERPCPTAIDPANPLARVQAHCSARFFPDAFEGAGATTAGLAAAALIVLAIGLFAWAALPSGITEYTAPPSVPPDEPVTASYARDATALGTWLSTGFRLGRRSVDLHVLAIAVGGLTTLLMLPFATGPLPALRALLRAAPDWLEPITLTRFLVTSGSAIGLLAVAQRFGTIGRGLRPILNIALDIANYMRERPRTRTPRARIMERFASLLRFVCRWRTGGAPDGGYDAVVVVAHSQGTVISADIFRYLSHLRACGAESDLERLAVDARERPLPLFLFTMGSPLRQLYAQRFPHLYAWSGDADPGTLFAVREWVNVYRSGDYVGRSLWVPDEPATCLPGHVLLDDGRRREYSIGTGAHTHYWDGSAAAVGMELDRLIGRALDAIPAAPAGA